MGFKNQSRFTAKIDNVDVYSIRSMINYKIDNLDDRMKCVEIALAHGDNFYMEYFDKYCDTELTADDVLLSESNVVQSLEAMANYILAKDDGRNDLEESYFVNERRMQDKMDREDEFNGTSISSISGFGDGFEKEEPKNNSNYKKLKTQHITSDDLNRNDYLGEVLRDYNSFLNLISHFTKKNNNGSGERIKHLPGKKADQYVYAKHHANVKDDMIVCKDALMKIHGYNLKNFGESTQPDYSVIDLTNKEHLLGSWVEYNEHKVKSNGLLSFEATDDYQNDFNCILVDVQNLVNNCKLTHFESEVLDLYRGGMSFIAIAKELNSYDMKVIRTMDKIADKVIVEAKKQLK